MMMDIGIYDGVLKRARDGECHLQSRDHQKNVCKSEGVAKIDVHLRARQTSIRGLSVNLSAVTAPRRLTE